MLQPAFIFTLLQRNTSHTVTSRCYSPCVLHLSLAKPLPKLPFPCLSSLLQLSFKHFTSKVLIPKSSNDGPQVISLKSCNYLSPDFKPQSVNTVFNICFPSLDQAFECQKKKKEEKKRKGTVKTDPKRQPTQGKQFVFYY